MERGRILVDGHLRTNVEGHYAAGDVIGGWLLAHVAFAEGICAQNTLLAMEARWTTGSCPAVSSASPSTPQWALRGRSPGWASDQGRPFSVQIARNGPGHGELEGMVKIIAHKETDQILGAHIVGPTGPISSLKSLLPCRQGFPPRGHGDHSHSSDAFRGSARSGSGSPRPGHSCPTGRVSIGKVEV